MKNFTLSPKFVLCTLLFVLSITTIKAQTTIASYSFENSYEGWADGGSDVAIYNSSNFSCAGTYSIYSKDDDTSNNRITSPSFDFTGYTSVEISFCHEGYRLDNGEGFVVQYFNGSTWSTVQTFSRGTDFANNGPFYSNSFTVTLNSGAYSFATNSRFRFSGTANANNEYNFFDDVVVTGYGGAPSYCNSNGNNSDGYNTGTRLVSFNTINNATPVEDNDYSDFTAISTTVMQSTAHNLTVHANTDGAYTTHTTAWIDWNQDFDFNDAGETYYLGTAFNTANGPTVLSPLSITIPATATLGNTRMRVSTRYGSAPTNCLTGFDGEVEDYTINVISGVPAPEINITGNAITINDGDTTPSPTDDTFYGSISVGSSQTRTYTIENNGAVTLNIGTITFSGANATEFLVTSLPANTIAAGSFTTFSVTFTPLGNGTRSATINVLNNDSDENPYNFSLQGHGVAPLTEGPGGVTADLALWLKANDGLGYTDGQPVSLWADRGRGSDATVHTPGQEPTYYDNAIQNINFNPVVNFSNNYTSVVLDGDYSYDDTSTEFLQGPEGMYTQDIFLVVLPSREINSSFGSMDVFCGDAIPSTNAPDATGIGFGAYSARVSGETICYAYDTFSQSEPGDGYAVHDGTTASYNGVGIINTRNNTGATQQELYYNANNIETTQNDIAEFANANNSRFWLGRSEGWEASFDGSIAEVITFSARKDDANLTRERNRIQSYLGIKYGITLGVNGTSQDYVDSKGNVIWDQSANAGFNHDIAGIARDDDSNLDQRQSKSVNSETDGLGEIRGLITVGLTDIYDTNNLNKSLNSVSLNDGEFLTWGNNNGDLNNAPNVVNVDMSSGIGGLSSTVTFTGMERVWKFTENGGDVPTVLVSIPQAAIRNINPPGDYFMFISDTPVFDPTAEYRVMKLVGSELQATYDFDGTKYVTFGYAPEREYVRSIYFDGVADYVDMEDNFDLNSTDFTLSAWIKRELGSNNTSIMSKRNHPFTEGYDFKIDATGRLSFQVRNIPTLQTVTGNTVLPYDQWHHVALIYESGQLKMYIDGIEDRTPQAINAPADTDQFFHVAAAGKQVVGSYYRGNIDEVRIWSTALNEDQLHYIMNQEIEENSNFVSGKIMPSTVTKNEINSVPWSNLAGYYPMSVYTYTNTKDESANRVQGALKNLNTVDYQTAPIPYVSNQNGTWNTDTTWESGDEQYIPGSASIVDSNVTIDWNIVVTSHDITMDNTSLPSGNDNNRSVLALINTANKLTLNGNTASNTGNAVTVSHYLKLDGKIDLEGESQLIQTEGSDFDVTSAGTLERDQQGTQDLYTYNYWSSPVGVTNTTSNNNSYSIPNILKDGTNPASPQTINFITNSYNGTSGSPIGIADYWIWKYSNQSGSYSQWQHVRSTGTIQAGEGFTMKGVNNTNGNVLLEQNYVTEGKPNNGDITLSINAGNEYLVGNPYASAIDAHEFIMDNAPTIDGAGSTTGTLYFWEHWGGGSHNLADYQGGYATYNLSGATPAASYGTNDPLVGTGGTPTKLPGRYIPVAQGFFVKGENTGNIRFRNSQRAFQKEGVSSVFVRSASESTNNNSEYNSDERMKFRIGFNSVNQIHRQLLTTVDPNATLAHDWGFDGQTNEDQIDDMYWMIGDDKYIIQGIGEVTNETVLPLGLHTDEAGINSITIDALENVPDDLDIFVKDLSDNSLHNLRLEDFQVDLPAGEHLNRFQIVFQGAESLSIDEFNVAEEDLNTYYSNENNIIVINNPKNILIKNVELLNILGQSIQVFNDIKTKNTIQLTPNKLSTGAYIIKINTATGSISKKVIIE